ERFGQVVLPAEARGFVHAGAKHRGQAAGALDALAVGPLAVAVVVQADRGGTHRAVAAQHLVGGGEGGRRGRGGAGDGGQQGEAEQGSEQGSDSHASSLPTPG